MIDLATEILPMSPLFSSKVRTLTFQKNSFISFRDMKALLNDEKCFLFHVKSYFRSQDI